MIHNVTLVIVRTAPLLALAKDRRQSAGCRNIAIAEMVVQRRACAREKTGFPERQDNAG